MQLVSDRVRPRTQGHHTRVWTLNLCSGADASNITPALCPGLIGKELEVCP